VNNPILKIGAEGSAAVVSITGLSTGLISPRGLAIDASGNLYIADFGNSRVVKVDSFGVGSVVSTPSITLSNPYGVAVDFSGNLYISDTGNNRIIKVTSSGTASVLTINSLGHVLSSPRGISTDSYGNLYIADYGDNVVVQVTASGSGSDLSSTQTLNGPADVKTRNNGTVYIVDRNTVNGSNTGQVIVRDSAGNSSVLLNGAAALQQPSGIAVNSLGTIYVADSGDRRVQSYQTTAVKFPSVSLHGSSTTLTLPFTVSSGVTLSAVAAYTAGVQGLDFTIANTSTCGAGTSNSNCTLDITFSPTAPGVRTGAVVLSSSSGNLTVPIYGSVDAPVVTINPGISTVVNTGTTALTAPYHSVVDGAGNIYVGNYTGNNVTKIPAGGGSGTVLTGSISTSQVTGLAMDGAGNLFFANYQTSGQIVEISNTGTVSAITINGVSLNSPTKLHFDAAGDLFITDYGNGKFVEVTPSFSGDGTVANGNGYVLATGGNSYPIISIPGSTVDAVGNLYIANRDTSPSQIIKVDPFGNSSVVSFPTYGSVFNSVQGLAVDPSGNLYVVDTGNKRIIRKTVSGEEAVIAFTGDQMGPSDFGVTPDAYGNLLIAEFNNNRLLKVDLGQGSLKFPDTQVLTQSQAPLTAVVANLGDTSLDFTAGPNYTTEFSLNTSDQNPCTSTTTLASGTSCNISAYFTPQVSGVRTGTLIITNNNWNVAGSTQQVALSGTGLSDTTTTTLIASTQTAVYGQTVNLQVSVADQTSSSVHPPGTIRIVDTITTTAGISQTTIADLVALDGSGNLTLPSVLLNGVGSHSIQASYVPSSVVFQASSAQTTIVIAQSPVIFSANNITLTFGQSGSAAIRLAGKFPNLTPPSGTVNYTVFDASNASVASGSATLIAGTDSSSASLSIPKTLGLGQYTIAVSYSGDTNYSATPQAGSISLAVGKATPTVAIAASATQLSFPGQVTLSANVSSTSGTPSGLVTFYDGQVALGTKSLSSGQAVLTTSLSVGSHFVRVEYAGDSNFLSANSTVAAVTVNQATPAVALAASATQLTFPGEASFTVTVSSSSGSPSGQVTFRDGQTILGTASLSDGQAVLAKSLSVGSHSITAEYSGDTNFTSATSSVIAITVNQATPAISLSASTGSATVFTAVSFTAMVNSSAGAPSGSVSFYDSTGLLGTEPLSNGKAVLTTSKLGVGSHTITAVYGGDGNFQTVSSSSVTVAINQATSAIALVSSANPILLTSAASFTATVTSNSGAPTGTVGFYDGTTLLGTVALSNGQAVYTTTSLAVGTHSITGVYSGDTNFAGATSSAIAELVQDFTIGSPASGGGSSSIPTLSVTPGGTATFTLSLGPSGGTTFPAPVTLSLSGLPPGATGTLSPTTLPAGSSLSNVTLTIQLPQQTAQVPANNRRELWVGGGMLAILLLPMAVRIRRMGEGLRRFSSDMILLFVFAIGIVSLSGCGAKASGYFAQAQKSYTIAITATSGSLSHSTTVTLVVQ
jgi:sugar lactone lactonase YvrE